MKRNPRLETYRDLVQSLGHKKALELACILEKETEHTTYHELYPLILIPKENQKKQGWFVSYYELYPIYEPAEGGYYYNGIGLSESREFKTRKQAIKFLNKCAKEMKMEFSNGIESCDDSELYINKDNTYMECIGKKYVGQGYFIQLERIQGKSESGKQVYC